MITSIIFSKNRACQLDLLLRSIKQNLPNLQEILILWHATTAEFMRGYYLVLSRYFKPEYIFKQQLEFEEDTINFIKLAKGYVCFFVDDNIIYRQCPALNSKMLDVLFDELNLTCFTLRLGTNTVIQDFYNNIPVEYPKDCYCTMMEEMVLFWDWTTIKTFGDFGYPFSVDGHIYKVKDLLPLLNYEFDTPNALEGRFDKNRFQTKKMACFEKSVLVNNPLNLVGSSNNNAGKFYGHSLEELNEKLLDNYQIGLDNICRNEIISAHQEMEIEFEKI